MSEACRRCGKVGHWAKECDLRFDVRFMDANKLEEQLEKKHAALDVAPPDTLADADPAVSTGDFVFHSG